MANYKRFFPAFYPMPATSLAAPVLLSMLVLSGCAVKQPLAIQSAGRAIPASSDISFIDKVEASPQQASMQASISKAMAKHSLTIGANAALLADVAATERPADIGFAKDKAEIDWTSQPRKQHWTDKCAAKRLRTTLVISERSSGNIVYRGTGEIIDCEFNASDYDNLAQRLVADATSKSGD